MSTHTPGPWEADDRGMAGGARFSGYAHCDDSTGSAVALTRFQFVARSEDEALANARLIAAAPDLLEALQQAIQCLEPDVFSSEYEAARAAIARATGDGA